MQSLSERVSGWLIWRMGMRSEGPGANVSGSFGINRGAVGRWSPIAALVGAQPPSALDRGISPEEESSENQVFAIYPHPAFLLLFMLLFPSVI